MARHGDDLVREERPVGAIADEIADNVGAPELPPVDAIERSTGDARSGDDELVAGDVLRKLSGTKRDVLPRARFVNASTALNMCPALRPDGLKGGIVGWDGQVEDDARLVVAVARTAAAYGAEILTHVDAVSLGDGRATLRDEDGEFAITAEHIITRSVRVASAWIMSR